MSSDRRGAAALVALPLLLLLASCDSSQVCEPETLQCSPLKNRVERCNADGTGTEVVDTCPGNTCVASGGSAACEAAPGVCTPGEVRCSDLKNRVETCSADGSAFETTATCPGNSCVVDASGGAACGTVPTFCSPGEVRCSDLENRVETCSADGSAFETTATCPGNSCVVDGSGPHCEGPELACDPGTTRCSATAANVVERCATDGNGWGASETCAGALVCATGDTGGGACQACTPGAKRCDFNGQNLEQCNAAGTAYEAAMACLFSSCGRVDGDYRCALPCTPGETRCANNGYVVETCNASGDAYATSERCLEQSCRVGDEGAARCLVPEVCSPGERRCSAVAANVVEECNVGASGWFARTTCPGLTECTTDDGGHAQCQVCVPGSKRCGVNDQSLETCNAAGTAYETEMACLLSSCGWIGGGYRCALPCTPGETRCASSNQIVQACNAAGDAYETAESCANNSCTTAFGPAACGVPKVCSPGERRCSAAAANQVEQCNTSGSGWYIQATCGGALTCIGSGSCQSCLPGSRSCGANNASVQVCNAAGTGLELAETCSSNSCKFQNGEYFCEYPCTPGELRCSALRNRIESCNADGVSYALVQTCTGNSCAETESGPVCNFVSVCTPGERRCSATAANEVEQCNTTGSGWYVQATCGGALTCSTATGSAGCQSCAPGSLRCGASNASVEKCNADATAYETVEACTSSSCKLIDGVSACEYPCVPGATRCSATGSQVQVCAAGGDAWTLAEPCLNYSCAASGAVAYCEEPQVCVPGARRCSASSANAVEQCLASGGGWYTATMCPGVMQCTLTASGTEGCQICVPGSRYCGANNASVMECNALGTAFEKAADCYDNSCRLMNGAISCDFPCEPGVRRCSPLKNRVDACDATGHAVTTVATCGGNSCVEAFGTATCTPPPTECEPGESRCATTGSAFEVCDDTGHFVSGGSCVGGVCQMLNGAASCSATVCQPNVRYCAADGNVHYCRSTGQDGGIQRVCAADETCGVLDGAASCMAAEVPMSCEPGIQFCGDDNVIYYCDANGQVSGVRATCDEASVCVVDANAPVCLSGYYETSPTGEVSCVVTEPATCVIVPKAFTTRGFVYAESEKLACDEPARAVRECGDQMECRDGHCTSSVSDEASPYYAYSCPLEQHLSYPTDLAADCRCFVNNSPVTGREICGRPYDRGTTGVSVGSGPRVFGLSNGHFSGGVIDGDELVVAAYWGSSTAQRGAVLAIDVDSGDRRLVTGDLGTATAGSGPALSYALDVRKGPDGKYYVFTQSLSPGAPSIYRVEPTTGVRTLVWRGKDASFGQCPAGDPVAAAGGASVQYTNNGFAVEPSGAFLVGYANAQRDGRGVVRISANGGSCTYVTATGARADGLTRGAGPDLGGFVQGFTVDGGKVLVQITQPKALVEIDLASGDRTVLIASGTAGLFGERWTVRDPARGVIWTAGLMNSVTIAAYDRGRNLLLDVFSSCGSAEFPWYPLCPGAGPIKINSMNYGGIWLHPHNGNLLVAQDSVSIVEFEPETANSVIRSL